MILFDFSCVSTILVLVNMLLSHDLGEDGRVTLLDSHIDLQVSGRRHVGLALAWLVLGGEQVLGAFGDGA